MQLVIGLGFKDKICVVIVVLACSIVQWRSQVVDLGSSGRTPILFPLLRLENLDNVNAARVSGERCKIQSRLIYSRIAHCAMCNAIMQLLLSL